MIEDDTIKLLRECDAGIKMGISAIDDVLDRVKDTSFKECLKNCKEKHEELDSDLEAMLTQYHDEGKNPCPVARGMSTVKTNIRLAMNSSDQTIAELITDGCNMGVKSLSKYLNQYKAASESSRDIAEKLIKLETSLADDIRKFL